MAVENKKRRVIYLQRKEKGCCPRCGKKLRKSYKFSYCEECRDFFRDYYSGISKSVNKIRKARYDQRKRKKQCPRCGKALGKNYKNTICAKCLGKQYKYNYGKDRT
jgi:predicted amidophosphoribosyltransferase